jgi:A/G-specific adenine glycosylase
MASAVSAWFGRYARELPWRVECEPRPGSENRDTRRDPYRSLVSEAMLQQTQVSRVIEKFTDFVARFPTVEALAAADEHDVLGMWSGLGYYRRAKNLHAAAKLVMAEFGGRVPQDVKALRTLPGVGRYTAGAIASIAFGERAGIVDGNVARVLLRVHGKDVASDDRSVQGWLWERAEALVHAAARPGEFNEGLMELGAMVCTPAAPKCGECPLRDACAARREGRQLEIPRPKARTARRYVYCAVAVVERTDGALLVERRGDDGMWAGMWQGVTIERTDRAPTAGELGRAVGVAGPKLTRGETFEFLATHRRMAFAVFRASAAKGFRPKRGEFRGREAIARLGISSPQRRVLLAGE